MRSLSLVVVGALSFFALSGCNGGQPRIYRVAIDNTNERIVGNSACYIGNQVPQFAPNQYTNFFSEGQWTIWGGVKNTEYLDVADAKWKLADSHEIDTYGLILGDNKKFTGTRQWLEPQFEYNPTTMRTENSYSFVYTTMVSVTFDDYSFSPVGTIDLDSKYQCTRGFTDCPGQGVNNGVQPPATSCAASLSFVARAIEADNVTPYDNNPATGAPQP